MEQMRSIHSTQKQPAKESQAVYDTVFVFPQELFAASLQRMRADCETNLPRNTKVIQSLPQRMRADCELTARRGPLRGYLCLSASRAACDLISLSWRLWSIYFASAHRVRVATAYWRIGTQFPVLAL